MGASKTHQYSVKEIQSARVANALGHPARIRIIKILKQNRYTRNIDLVKELELSKSTINMHLHKLVAADLIELQFLQNFYLVKPIKRSLTGILNEFEEMN